MVRIAKCAERHAANIARNVMGCVVLWCAPTVKYQNTDIFGSDIVGKDSKGRTFYIQVTTGGPQAVRTRKKKMESIPWGEHDRVLLFVYPKGVGSLFWPKVFVWSKLMDAEGNVHREWLETKELDPFEIV